MLKLIAVNGAISLFQTGFTTIYEETALETHLPSGHLVDEEGKVIPVSNIDSVINSAWWEIISEPDEYLGKGRKRQFSSRAEAGRYAAQIRWGNRGTDIPPPVGNPLPVEATMDIDEAIMTGAPYAPFLEENFPPEIREALDRMTNEEKALSSSGSTARTEARVLLQDYYMSHLDPERMSPQTIDAMAQLGGTGQNNYRLYVAVAGEGSNQKIYRTGQRIDMADRMAEQTIAKRREIIYTRDLIGEQEALDYTRGMVASPNLRIAVAVHGSNVVSVLNGGFKTQFETNTSGGARSSGIRAAHEAVAYGVHPATIPSRRPIYANLHPVGVQSTRTNRSEQYGEIQFVVKKSVHDRSTFSTQDSLGSSRTAAAVKGPIRIGQASPNARKDVRQVNHPKDKPSKAAKGEKYEYAEAQIQKGLKIDDIDYVTLPKGARLPAGAAAILKRLGIPVRRTVNDDVLDDSTVAKAFDATVSAIRDAVEKAKGFDGNRSAAGAYAAHIRWGNRGGMTPRLEAIAAQSEAAVVNMMFPESGNDDDLMMDAIEGTGFVGNGPRPPAAPNYDDALENETLRYYAPDYHLLPEEMQTKEVIDKQQRIFEARQKLVQNYYDGEGKRPYRDVDPSQEKSRTADILGITEYQIVTSEGKLTQSTVYGPDGKEYEIKLTNKPQFIPIYDRNSRPDEKGRFVFVPSKQAIAKDKEEKEKIVGTKKLAQIEGNKKIDAWLGVKVDRENLGTNGKQADPRNIRIAQIMGDAAGFHRGAQKVGANDFDALARSGKFVVVFRGGTKDEIDSLFTTHPHIGGGEQGLGTYTAYGKSRAAQYGETTPMLIPRTALTRRRARGDTWNSSYGDTSGYLVRANVEHGESERKSTSDLKVLNVSMLIIGPRGHDKGYGTGRYVESIDAMLRDEGLR